MADIQQTTGHLTHNKQNKHMQKNNTDMKRPVVLVMVLIS